MTDGAARRTRTSLSAERAWHYPQRLPRRRTARSEVSRGGDSARGGLAPARVRGVAERDGQIDPLVAAAHA